MNHLREARRQARKSGLPSLAVTHQYTPKINITQTIKVYTFSSMVHIRMEKISAHVDMRNR